MIGTKSGTAIAVPAIPAVPVAPGLLCAVGDTFPINIQHLSIKMEGNHKGVATIEATEAAASVINSASYILKINTQQHSPSRVHAMTSLFAD